MEKYKVTLTSEERFSLEQLVGKGKTAARKLAHARASVIKLHASEMAGRVLDKAVQIFGGRGYMRENPVERLNRDVRVDRIWEGTSEIQRAIIGGQLAKRGTDPFTGWYRPPAA